jgi:hypothetical protein
MNTDVIDDLKQFIVATNSQQVAQLRKDLRADIRSDLHDELDSLESRLSTKIDDLSASVAEAMDKNTELTDERLDDHEVRITRLEQT